MARIALDGLARDFSELIGAWNLRRQCTIVEISIESN
jgi:hypothetical protein